MKNRKMTVMSYDEYLRIYNIELEKTTLRLLNDGCPIADIAQVSGISEGQLEQSLSDEQSSF